ncbi:MAG: glycosyltransferase family 4 protein [Verrucomicrobiales bacterium]
MTISILTAGTGSYYCGACMRDHELARHLRAAGHEVALVPLYLPLTLDEVRGEEAERGPVFYGGINVWLQEKWAFFRKTPAWLDRLFNGRSLLRSAAKRSHLTSAHEQGEMSWRMLVPEEAHLQKESGKLLDWLREHEKPDVILLSNALLAGMARELKTSLGVPVFCAFQGEDSFLDGLPTPWRERCWEALGERLEDCDGLIAPSRFYAELMAGRLKLSAEDIEIIPNGVRAEEWPVSCLPDDPPVIGYLARQCEIKGLGVLVDAFIDLRTRLGDERTRLAIAGTATAENEPFIKAQQEKLAAAGLGDEVTWQSNISREEKEAFLASLTLFSVPATYAEAFGLYLVEAMAAGLPLVQPRAAAFTEILAQSQAGRLHEPGEARDLARVWQELLGDRQALVEVGRKARQAAEGAFGLEAVAQRYLELFQAGPRV